MKKRKFFSFISALVLICSILALMPTSISAASDYMQLNLSPNHCTSNLSVSALPASGTPFVGDSFYVNFAATTGFKLKKADFFVKTPGASSFTCIYSYAPSGFFRYSYCYYYFGSAGYYEFYIEVTTTSGLVYGGSTSITVSARPNASETASSSDTYSYAGYTFAVVPNFKSDYCFNQKDYSRFVNWKGSNRGCTATAMCIAYSIYHDSALSPNDVKWCSDGTSWEYCKRYSDSTQTYYGYTFTQSEALKAIYNCLTDSDKPIIAGVNGAGCDHVVTVVGVKQGIDTSKLSLGDFLIVDPNGGTICTLDKYSSIDRGWALRVPID